MLPIKTFLIALQTAVIEGKAGHLLIGEQIPVEFTDRMYGTK